MISKIVGNVESYKFLVLLYICSFVFSLSQLLLSQDLKFVYLYHTHKYSDVLLGLKFDNLGGI